LAGVRSSEPSWLHGPIGAVRHDGGLDEGHVLTKTAVVFSATKVF
jgi:hypothetical protein